MLQMLTNVILYTVHVHFLFEEMGMSIYHDVWDMAGTVRHVEQ